MSQFSQQSSSASQSSVGPSAKRYKFFLPMPLSSLLQQVIDDGQEIWDELRSLLPLTEGENQRHTLQQLTLVEQWMAHAKEVSESLWILPDLAEDEAFPEPLSERPVYRLTCNEYKQELKNFMSQPPSMRGIALKLLHSAFQRFQWLRLNPAQHPADTDLLACTRRVVTQLMEAMPRAFYIDFGGATGETQKVQQFQEIIAPLLGNFLRDYYLKFGIARVDGAWFPDDCFNYKPIAFLEVKVELGTTGDPYMQLVRTYQLAVEELRSRSGLRGQARAFLDEGAPMFLILIARSYLQVSGAFYDGKNTLVEPFSPTINLLEDSFGKENHNEAIQVLYALAVAMRHLKSRAKYLRSLYSPFPSYAYITFRELLNSPSPPFPPLTPRVYQHSWKWYDTGDEPNPRLEFIKPLSGLASRRCLFSAHLEDSMVVVKVVDGRYGEEVHQLLATKRLAPRLLAYARPDQLPMAYAMEDLSEWKTLEAVSIDWTEAQISCVRQHLRRVLDCLNIHGKVHGDLRPANIMFQMIGDEVEIQVVDFDWAGDAGIVTYPDELNSDLEWSGKPGARIDQEHDFRMVLSWWPKRFPGSEISSSVATF